jgi:hypothetical protein
MKKISTTFFSLFLTIAAFAQIPNPSFETWTSGTYDDPTSWGNLNSSTSTFSVYTCEKGTTGAPSGSAFIKLTSKTALTLVAPGVAVTGELDVVLSPLSVDFSGGFPYSTRSASLTGKWQHMGAGADHGRVGVFFTKWNTTTNSRDTVAMADSMLTGMAMSWSDFTIPLTYMSGANPDTGIIVLMSSADPITAVNGSYLYADQLAFTGTVPTGIVTVKAVHSSLSLFPNPATSQVTVYYHSASARQVEVVVTDLSGKQVRSQMFRAISGENNFVISTKGLVKGMYLIQVNDAESNVQQKLFVD